MYINGRRKGVGAMRISLPDLIVIFSGFIYGIYE